MLKTVIIPNLELQRKASYSDVWDSIGLLIRIGEVFFLLRKYVWGVVHRLGGKAQCRIVQGSFVEMDHFVCDEAKPAWTRTRLVC